jgi:Putative auto-transporter adhesin, head GIN domain
MSEIVTRNRWAVALPVLLAAAALAGGCGGVDPGRAASGETASRRVDAPGATGLVVEGGFEVRVTLGRPELAVVTFDRTLADLLDVGVDGGTLRVRVRPHDHIGRRPVLRAEVTVRRLEELRVAGGATVAVTGTVRGSGLRLELARGSRVAADLGLEGADATLSGTSRLKLTGAAGRLQVDASGASNLALSGLSLRDLDIQLSGASQADVRADGTITAQLSGASHLTYQGTPRFISRDTSGASSISPA